MFMTRGLLVRGVIAAVPAIVGGIQPAKAIFVRTPPPPPPHYAIVVAHRPPHPGMVWAPGYYGWHRGHYTWVRGGWAVPPRREVFGLHPAGAVAMAATPLSQAAGEEGAGANITLSGKACESVSGREVEA